ncbi:MAG: glucose-6-phosphate 1-dehydrogenase [Acetobacteraceae bacterium]|jgi:glucose-6-phosphate 1-dehydrogenase|nr:glucose-6-phosphate 1-dehydrogenase [Acetobacteraceae bacterium]
MVIFGAGGDLTKRLLVPALYNLATTCLLPEQFELIGVDLADLDADKWRDSLHTMMESFVGKAASESRIDKVDEETWKRLTGRVAYIQGDLNDDGLYQKLKQHLDQTSDTGGNCLFYLAIADRFFGPVVTHLGKTGLLEEDWDEDGKAPKHWRRVVIEKPFGHDRASAKALNATILRCAEEHQIYRIDHFLGKETVQNIMALRFANGIFEPLWNRDRIDHVQITVAETVGVETRGRFYEKTGALRDMIPNHVFQLLAMVAMEPPGGFDAHAVRSRKADVFAALRTVAPKDAVRGQYGPGPDGVAGYRQEKDVAPDSGIETYAAMQLAIDNWRWAGVPFYLRTGKHMSRRVTEIAIRFKPAPFAPFEDTNVAALPPNWLLLQIQPDEGIALQFEVKRPGPVVDLAAVRMAFKYADWFPKEPNIGYETLIYDVMTGDQTLFNRADMVEETWRVVSAVLDDWSTTPPVGFPNYASGTDGPPEADALLAREGRSWRPTVDDGKSR